MLVPRPYFWAPSKKPQTDLFKDGGERGLQGRVRCGKGEEEEDIINYKILDKRDNEKTSSKILCWLKNSSAKEENRMFFLPLSIHMLISILLQGEHLKYHCARYSRWKYQTCFFVVCDYAEINSGNCELRCLFIITLLSLLHLLLHLCGAFLLVSRLRTI